MKEAYLLWIVVIGVVGIYAADKTVTVGDVTTKVLGQSGKIVIFKESNETNGIKVTFDFIEELDTNGETIKGQAKHSFNTFAPLEFTFSELENSTYASDNVSVTKFSFTATIPIDGQDATLTSYVYIFTERGNITVDGESLAVKEGDVKFNVKIENWAFCGQGSTECRSGQTPIVGQNLDFGIEIKNNNEDNETVEAPASDSNTYDFGGGSKVIVPKKVNDRNTSLQLS